MSSSFTLTKTTGTRTFTLQELNALSFRPLASGLSFQKSGGLVYHVLDQHGRMLIQEVGPNWFPGQALYEAFTPSWSTSQAFSMEFVPKTGGSSVGSIVDALVSLGFQQYAGLSSLDTVHALLFSQPVPSQARWKGVDNSSQETTLALTRNHNTYQTRQFYGDLGPIGTPHNFRLTRQHITQNFDSGIPVNNVAASKVELAGMYMIDVGDGQTVKIGPTNRRPVISLVGDATVGVQVGDTWTEAANGGVSAQDAGGDALTVVTTGTVDTSILGISTLTYTAVSSQGDIAGVKQRFIVATDTTSPVLTLTGGNISLPVGDTWGGEQGYSATDNLDGDVTSQVQITGWSGDTSVAGQLTRTYAVTDSQGNVASTFRVISIADPSLFEAAGPFTSRQWFPTGLGTSMTSEPDQMSRGQNHGYQVRFSYKAGSDYQGVILAVTDSSFTGRFYEGPSTTAALAFRLDYTWGVMVRMAQSDAGWGNNRYLYEAAGHNQWWMSAAHGHTQTNWNEVTLRVFDLDSSNWGFVLFVNGATSGSQYASRSLPKGFPGPGPRSFPGRTSTWTGVSYCGVETAGAITTSAGWRVEGGEVKDFSISALNPAADHTVP